MLLGTPVSANRESANPVVTSQNLQVSRSNKDNKQKFKLSIRKEQDGSGFDRLIVIGVESNDL